MLKRYRAYPPEGQARTRSRVFGCTRVVFDDVVAARRAAHRAGAPYESATTSQSRPVTQAKRTPERAWPAGVSSTPLGQAVRDADRAYRTVFTSLSGKRRGRRSGAPRVTSRKDRRQSARSTRSAQFRGEETTHGVGFLTLPKIGRVGFVSSRPLPADPSSVPVVREADGRHPTEGAPPEVAADRGAGAGPHPFGEVRGRRRTDRTRAAA